jgi:hypothetical protein
LVSSAIAEKAKENLRIFRGEATWATEHMFTCPEHKLCETQKSTKSKLELFITRKKLLKMNENLVVVRAGTDFKIKVYFHTFSQIPPSLLHL